MIPNYKEINAIHESGHALMIRLFEDYFEFKTITLSPKIFANKHEISDWEGGVLFKMRPKFSKKPTLQDKDKLIIIMWSGLVAQNVFVKGIINVKENIDQYVRNTDLLDWSGCDDDWEFTIEFIREQIMQREITFEEYKVGFLRFAFNYFLDERVWETVLALSNVLQVAPNATINKKRFNKFLSEIGFAKYLCNVKAVFLKDRYPVVSSIPPIS